jgi:O-antigen/teichoic acid export membrane protein
MNASAVSKIGKRVSTFIGGQSAVQLLNAATGLMLLRMMSKPDFAIYAIALGIQGMITILTDIGFGGAIAGLVGTRYQDKALLGSYIRTASHLRQILLIVITGAAVVLAVAFKNIEIRAHGRKELILLALAVLLTLQFQAWASYYEIPLILNNKLVSYYGPQIVAAALRIVSSIGLYYLHWISSTTVIVANTLSIVIMGVSYRVLARPWIHVPRAPSKEHSREMLKFLVPLLPGTVYQALQGQISLFLIAVFGHIGQIAEVAAAGRIGQLFLLLNSSNGILVGPFFSKSPRALFLKRYAYTMAAVGGIALVVAASAKLCPGAYLLLLGARYSNLTPQVQLVVYASAIGYFSGAMWSVAVARKWVFWWSGSLQMVLLTLIQIVCVLFIPLSTSEGVLKMNIFTACGALTVQVLHVIQGLSVHAKAEASEVIAS